MKKDRKLETSIRMSKSKRRKIEKMGLGLTEYVEKCEASSTYVPPKGGKFISFDLESGDRYLVVLDLVGAKAGKMPRTFYRRLKKLQGFKRIQKSVYLVEERSLYEFVTLSKKYGFHVQTFKIASQVKIENSSSS